MPAVRTAVVTAALAGLLALAAVAGAPVLLAAALLVGLTVSVGWAPLLDLPSPRGTTALVSGTAGVAVAVASLTAGDLPLRWLAPALGISVLAAFVHQLLRRDGRPRLVESVTGAVAGQVVVVLAAAWLAAAAAPAGTSLVLVAAAALGAAGAATALPWPVRVRGVLALAAGTAFAALASVAVGPLDAVRGAVVGLAVGGVVAVFDGLFHRQPRSRTQPGLYAVAATPVAVTGTLVHVLARVLSL